MLLPIVHSVPIPWRARAGACLTLKVRRAVTEGVIARVPEGAFRPTPFPFMSDQSDPTRAYAHDGRIWQRLAGYGRGPDGMPLHREIPLRACIEVLRDGPRAGCSPLPVGSPLHPWHSADPEGDVDEADPVQAAALAGCRRGLRAYLRDDLRIAGDRLYVRIGLPCLAGVRAPMLCGAGPGWRLENDIALTRHDRVAAHVRYAGRVQADDESARFRYLAGLVERVAEGIVPDEMATALFVDRLALLAFHRLVVHDRRWRREDPERHAAMRREMEGLAPLAALGMVGATAPEDRMDCVRGCLGALDRADLGKSARAERARLRAFAEEVVIPALEPSGSEVESDMAALAALGP